MDRAITAILRFPPIVRKMQREMYARGEPKVGIAIAYHHVLIMKMLQELGMLNTSELGAMIFVSNAQMTHSTEKLMWLGLIEKDRDIVDRRKVNIRLTPKGEETIQTIHEVMVDLVRERLSGLSDSDLQKLAESFDNIVEVFSI